MDRGLAVLLVVGVLLSTASTLGFLVLPGSPGGNPWLDRGPLVVAHRGSMEGAPEHTVHAYRHALRCGADAIEVDLWPTRDGHLVAMHTPWLQDTTPAEGLVVNMPLHRVTRLDAAHWFVPGEGVAHDRDPGAYPLRGVATGREPPPPGVHPENLTVPSLREILEAFPNASLVLEVKAPLDDAGDHLVELLHRYDRGNRTVVASFHDHRIESLQPRLPEGVATMPGTLQATAWWSTARDPLPWNPRLDHRVVVLPLDELGTRLLDAEVVQRGHDADLAVWAMALDGPADAEDAVALGVDAVVTEEPCAVADAVFGERPTPWEDT